MPKTVSAHPDGCQSHRLHRREIVRLERELLDLWEHGRLLRSVWEISPSVVERAWDPVGPALLTTYWSDMGCGCEFGALQVVPLGALDGAA